MTSLTLTTPALEGRELVHMAPDPLLLAPRKDGARIVGDMGAAPQHTQNAAPVPLAKPIPNVADSRATLPRTV